MDGPPPPPPPHGSKPSKPKDHGLPDGKYDIFVIPPSSAGSGFLYLPSMQTHRNSFLLGCLCTSMVFVLYSVLMPVVRRWILDTIEGGGTRVLSLMAGVGVICWALGKVQNGGLPDLTGDGGATGGSSRTQHSDHRGDHTSTSPPQSPRFGSTRVPTPPPHPHADSTQSQSKPQQAKSSPRPQSSWQRPTDAVPPSDGKSAWERAREETRKREEERRRAAEIQRRRDELEKQRQKQREKETLEKLEREWKQKKTAEERATAANHSASPNVRLDADQAALREQAAKERADREAKLQALREAREREANVKADPGTADGAARATKAGGASSQNRRPPMPTAKTERDDDAYSFRPYDRQKSSHHKSNSADSIYSDDASSYAPSATTAKTTPPASTRGPYSTKDPDKIIIKGCYSFNNAFMRIPISQLTSGQGQVTDGLILRITTEGLFIDDDVRSAPQREWDVKAWTLKLCESTELQGHHILRASVRDQEGKKYVFVMAQTESWKVAIGLQRLRKGSQVRALGIAGMPTNEAKAMLENLGWL